MTQPALGDICSLPNYSIAYEETQSKKKKKKKKKKRVREKSRVSDFRDFVCSLFPKAIIFWLLFYSTVAGVVLCGGRKKSPRTSSLAGYTLFPFGSLSPFWLFWKLNTHYENMSIQIYWKFPHLKMNIFRKNNYIYISYFCSKHRLLVLVRTASARRF